MRTRSCDILNWFHEQYIIKDMGYVTPCWIWQRATNSKGYGNFRFCYKRYNAHKWIWQKINKRIADKDLHHKCEIKSCVNPAHLEELSRSEHVKISPNHINNRGKLRGPSLEKKLVIRVF